MPENGNLSRDEYTGALKDLFSKDPNRIKTANRLLFGAAVHKPDNTTEPDLALAEAAVHS